jgi:hypothetical protein
MFTKVIGPVVEIAAGKSAPSPVELLNIRLIPVLPRAKGRRSAPASACRACKSLERRGLASRNPRGIRLTEVGAWLAKDKARRRAVLVNRFPGDQKTVNGFLAGEKTVNGGLRP